MSDDPIMQQVNAAIALLHGGERAAAKAQFEAIWASIAQDPDPFHECTLAHFMADAQDDPAAELAWDLRALEAARRVPQRRAGNSHAGLAMRTFFPSLHLNVADAYRRLGDMVAARKHLEEGAALAGALPQDGYGAMIRGGFERLRARLAEEKGNRREGRAV
jgi:hypothetical protein